jgi:hypothetical protein
VAVKIPRVCHITGSRAIHKDNRGEYAIALNCTITNASANTTPVRESMPVPTDPNSVSAEEILSPERRLGRRWCSSRGRVSPMMIATRAY